MAENCSQAAMLAVLDNEEVGSTTKQGAASDFLKETAVSYTHLKFLIQISVRI